MKKLALTLAALATVSAVASAKEVVAAPVVAVEPVVAVVCPEPVKPMFRATYVNFEVEWEREYADKGVTGSFSDLVYYGTVGFAYGDNWTGSLQGARWHNIKGGDWINTTSRVQWDVTRSFKFDGGKQFNLGARVRNYSEEDRYYLRPSYRIPTEFVTFGGWADLAYKDISGVQNRRYIETEPMNLTFNTIKFGTVGPLTVGYYYYNEQGIADSNEYKNVKDQVRFTLPLYKADKFSVAFHQRIGLKEDTKNATGEVQTNLGHFSDGVADYNMSQLKFGYAYSESLDLYMNVAYGRNKWTNNEGKKVNADYSDVVVGFTHKF